MLSILPLNRGRLEVGRLQLSNVLFEVVRMWDEVRTWFKEQEVAYFCEVGQGVPSNADYRKFWKGYV